MFLPDAILLALLRWLRLLRSSPVSQATEILRVGSEFSDLTMTQYAAALEWATDSQLLEMGPAGLQLSKGIRELPDSLFGQMLFRAILQQAAPLWLTDADVLVSTPREVPQDALELAEKLGVNERDAFTAIMQIHGRIDVERRSLIGAAGEREFVAFLEKQWPGSTNHIALTSDGFGYDVVFRHATAEWHLEVKSTVRRGRLVIHLTRHEHEVGALDPAWRLIVVALDGNLRLRRIASVRHEELFVRAPNDVSDQAKWQTVSHQLHPSDLEPGLPFVVGSDPHRLSRALLSPSHDGDDRQAYECMWMP